MRGTAPFGGVALVGIGETPAVRRSDRTLPQLVMDAIDLLHEAKVEKISLLTDPKQGAQ